MQNYLHQIRSRFNTASDEPRRFSLQEMVYNRLVLPEWTVPLSANFEYDPREYQRLIHERRDLLCFGEVVCAHLVQANGDLYEAGDEDLPGLVLYSHDPFYERDITELKRVAHMIFELKETNPSHPDLIRTSALVSDDYAVCSHFRLPDSLTGGREVFMCDLLVFRKHLPGPKLESMWAPLLVDRGRCRHVMILPAYYWPEELVELW